MTIKKYMLDTNVYDFILDNCINLDIVQNKGELYITNVQISEIKNIKDKDRQFKILNIIHNLEIIKINLESGIWLDDLYWDDDQPWIDEISNSCISLLGNTINNKPWKDALIGEVAKKLNLILVTNDNGFNNKAIANGILTSSISDFLEK